MRGVFVTGTDTGVGKTIVAGAVCASLTARGRRIAAFKPVVTGLDERPPAPWAHDHELLAAAAGGWRTPEEVAPYRFGPPVSPHFAAELAQAAIDPARIVASAREAAVAADTLVCEGVGGLLVPLTRDFSVRDLAVELKLPIVVVARSGLGTISHSLLTVEAARAVGLHVVAVVMSPWPARPDPLEASNRATVQELAGVGVCCLPATAPAELAAAGEELPIEDWL